MRPVLLSLFLGLSIGVPHTVQAAEFACKKVIDRELARMGCGTFDHPTCNKESFSNDTSLKPNMGYDFYLGKNSGKLHRTCPLEAEHDVKKREAGIRKILDKRKLDYRTIVIHQVFDLCRLAYGDLTKHEALSGLPPPQKTPRTSSFLLDHADENSAQSIDSLVQ